MRFDENRRISPSKINFEDFWQKGLTKLGYRGIIFAFERMAPWPSGKAKVCNTSIPGPIPGGASKNKKPVPKDWLFIFSVTTRRTGSAVCAVESGSVDSRCRWHLEIPGGSGGWSKPIPYRDRIFPPFLPRGLKNVKNCDIMKSERRCFKD